MNRELLHEKLWEDVIDIFYMFCNQWNVISLTNYVYIYNLRLTNINCFLVWEFLTFNLTSINNSKRWKFANRSLLNIYKDFSIWILSATSLMDLMGGEALNLGKICRLSSQYFLHAMQVKTGLNNEYIPWVSMILMSSISPNPPSLASRRFYPSFSVLFLLYCDTLTFVIVSGRRTEWRGHGTLARAMFTLLEQS